MVVYGGDAGWEELTIFVQSQLLLAVERRLAVVRLEHPETEEKTSIKMALIWLKYYLERQFKTSHFLGCPMNISISKVIVYLKCLRYIIS